MFSHIPLKDNSIPLGKLQMSAPDLAALTVWSSTCNIYSMSLKETVISLLFQFTVCKMS